MTYFVTIIANTDLSLILKFLRARVVRWMARRTKVCLESESVLRRTVVTASSVKVKEESSERKTQSGLCH